jgi:hypothetical protein
METLADLRRDFGGDFSSGAFRHIDEEANIVGRFGRIREMPDGTYDVWFVPADIRTGHSGRRMAGSRRACEAAGDKLILLDGEGYARGRGRDFVLRMAVLAGVRRKGKMSPARLAALARARALATESLS